jgi:ribonuclease HI
MESEDGADAARAEDLVATGLAPEVVLVTYDSVTQAGRARRSSVWVRDRGRWQLRAHQGTPVPTPPTT